MISNAYSIRDNKTASYAKPFFAQNDILATRALHTAVNDPNIQLSMFPEDFDMYHVGEFDDQTGMFETCQPRFVIAAVSLKKITQGGRNE